METANTTSGEPHLDTGNPPEPEQLPELPQPIRRTTFQRPPSYISVQSNLPAYDGLTPLERVDTISLCDEEKRKKSRKRRHKFIAYALFVGAAITTLAVFLGVTQGR